MTHSLRRAGAALIALAAGLFVVLSFSPAANAAAPPDAQAVVSSWKDNKDPLFVESGSPLSSDVQTGIRDALKDAKTKIYAVALPDGTVQESDLGPYFKSLGTALDAAGRTGATIAVLDGSTLFASSSAIKQTTLNKITGLSINNGSGDGVKVMQEFVKRVDDASAGKRSSLDTGPVSSSGSGSGALIALGGLALVGGGGYFLYSKNKKKKRLEQEARDLAMVKGTVEEDVTKFGEEITALDTDVTLMGEGGQHITEWQQALDSYEKAKTQLDSVQRADQVRDVTTTLEDGRYALAVVKAKVNDQPVPERRAPCFFNPQHGPSVRDVRWAPPGGAVRDVPACATDAQAVENGFDPQMREVMVNGQRRPYYDAGPAYQPYAQGYYGGFGDIMTGMFIGTMMGSMMMGGFGGYGGGYGGDSGGGDAGGGDFGGGDAGGGWGDFGGGDFGGGDFGGGDW